jgi:hypothetical protein
MRARDVDPALDRQLDAAQGDEPVEAVLLLWHGDDQHKPPIDAEALMRRVCRTDDKAEMNYMPRIGTLVVRASTRVIRLLISQPEVEMASANREIRD